MLWRWMLACLAAIAFGACTPTLDWREVRPEGSGAQALFPCKPASHSREVSLAGAQVKLTLHAFSAGNAVYALGVADMRDPARVAPALLELRDSARRNLGAGAADAQPLSVAGMTPNAQAARLRLSGRRPDGVAVHEELALFARGTTVYQATVLGAALDAEAVQNFVGGLRVAP